jgi:hypothetical protein
VRAQTTEVVYDAPALSVTTFAEPPGAQWSEDQIKVLPWETLTSMAFWPTSRVHVVLDVLTTLIVKRGSSPAW